MPIRGRLRHNIVALSILQMMNYAAPLITVPYLTRVLGPEHFGMLAVAQAVIVYFDLITDYGFNLSATRRVAEVRHDSLALARVFWSTLLTKLLLMLGCAAAAAGIVSITPGLRPHAALYAGAFLTVVGSALFPVWLFQGAERMKFLTIGMVSARFASIPILMLTVHGPNDDARAAAVQGAVPIAAALLVAPALWRSIGIRAYRPSISDIVERLREGWSLFISNTAMFLFSSTTVVLLGLVAGNTEAGYYSASDKLIKAANSLINPLTQALYPHLNSLRRDSPDAARRLIRKSMLWIGGVTLAASVAAFAAAGPLVHLLLGPRFGPSAAVLRCMSPLLLLLGLCNVLGTQTMIVFELDAAVSRIMLVSAIVGACLTVLFSARWGAPGAALATVSGATLMLALMVRALRKAQLAVWRQPQEACVS